MPTQKPRKIGERMTPEFPRAPMSAPCDARRAVRERSESSRSGMSSTADCKVRSMLVPVSPSGTGKTFRESTSSRLTVSHASEPSRASLNRRPSHSVMGMVAVPVRLGISAAATPADVDPLDVDVDFHDGETEGTLDRIPNRVREVVGDLRDACAVLDDDVERDRHPVLAHFDLDTTLRDLRKGPPVRAQRESLEGAHEAPLHA